MSAPKSSKIKYWLLIAAAIVIDQITKTLVLQRFQFAERLNIIPDFFDLTLVFNTGAAFSFLADAGGWQKYFFLALAAVISFYLARAIVKDDFGAWGKWGAAMVIGGAFGNVIDRLIHGHVVDFLLFYWQSWFYPAFNAADSFICVGAVMLVIDGFKHKKEKAAGSGAEAV
ncbi:signal peptidase II [Neisseria dentiae]|uniref:Lipoprotein signal peptidase n=1 Tax=Neisseria dentiae TaxID=194197 RepID=A0A1X3DFL3_9NEIS|nr:signal peptidase II [Neisseria dentiae]OSI18596.1 signal peptidase II [Neisseria dentiae]QMT45513.1 lipoprotein signal peptidase [Neisseria dentiae]STZ51407.1 lipoprotein signal peptidase [Neisseria dentiae]